MTLFVDTSAFYALLDEDDAKHKQAAEGWLQWLKQGQTFVTSNYIVIECWNLLQARLGLEAVRVFHEELLPVVYVEWVSQALHEIVVRVVLASGKRGISLVDRISFELMRQRGMKAAFSFDEHFADEGFTILPES
ncbi:MAG: type II toxin-antitoxin system VapC family toxin [Nitrososphaerales archaeon]